MIQAVLALIILGILYRRMIQREIPGPVSGPQAVAPVLLGIVSTPLSFVLFLGIAIALKRGAGVTLTDLPPVAGALCSAFFGAGLPEEVTKLCMLLLFIRIFRPKIRNVYEYILAGAGVGFGFTLFEEFLYGSGALLSVRLALLAAHMFLNMIMGKHLGLARYKRLTGRGSAGKEVMAAILIPMLFHTIYDACTTMNMFLSSGDDTLVILGMAAGIAAYIIMFAAQILILVGFRKDTDRYCSMSLLPQETGDNSEINID